MSTFIFQVCVGGLGGYSLGSICCLMNFAHFWTAVHLTSCATMRNSLYRQPQQVCKGELASQHSQTLSLLRLRPDLVHHPRGCRLRKTTKHFQQLQSVFSWGQQLLVWKWVLVLQRECFKWDWKNALLCFPRFPKMLSQWTWQPNLDWFVEPGPQSVSELVQHSSGHLCLGWFTLRITSH